MKARLVSEIGEELISSDAVALYELIKNSYDAEATFARICVKTPFPPDILTEFEDDPQSHSEQRLSELVDQLKSLVTKPETRDGIILALQSAAPADRNDTLVREFRRASRIVVEDDGHGMSRDTVDEDFLAIGTPMRREQRRSAPSGRKTLGEKGVGRFSTMRLGRRLRVDTLARNSREACLLDVDWSLFSSESDLDLEEVMNSVWTVSADEGRSHGTTLTITDLNAVWTHKTLKSITLDQLSKLQNPFFPASFRLIVRFNGESIDTEDMHREVLQLARAHIRGDVVPQRDPVLLYTISINGSQREPSVKPMDHHMPTRGLEKAGPFQFEIYEFNRSSKTLRQAGQETSLSKFLRQWGEGGLFIFRDGFRVMPYGNRGIDWLEIDKAFFAERTGTRLRVHAITGYVAITSDSNPNLIDQTNREGLRENEAYDVFKRTMKCIVKIINNEFAVHRPAPPRESAQASVEYVRASSQRLRESFESVARHVSELRSAVTTSGDAASLAAELLESTERMRKAVGETEAAAQKVRRFLTEESRRYQPLLELAGLGMTAEQISHELNSLLDRARGLTDSLRATLREPAQVALLGQLSANITSVRKLTSFLDPLTNASRRRRSDLDIVREVETVVAHYPDISSGKIRFRLSVQPKASHLTVRMNRGVLVQVLDNLFTNSLFWLRNDSTPHPSITVTVDAVQKLLVIEDNGPGIDPDHIQSAFEPFFSTKPDGRGLGLYIASELLALEGATLSLLPDRNDRDRLHRFAVNFGNRPPSSDARVQ